MCIVVWKTTEVNLIVPRSFQNNTIDRSLTSIQQDETAITVQ